MPDASEPSAEASVKALEAERNAALAMLRRLEWRDMLILPADDPPQIGRYRMVRACIACCGAKPSGHEDGCELAALLKGES